MDQYELIRVSHRVYQKSIRRIAAETGHHRNTIRKALLGQEPNYRQRPQKNGPVMKEVAEIVEEWLKKDRESPKKQRHTARRIYTRLVEEHGFKGAESTVRTWVRRKKQELGFDRIDAMVPLSPEVGKEAEVDWGQAQAIIQGRKVTVHLFCMRCRYSGKSFVRAYPLEKQEMFFEAHIHAFSYFGGVHPVIVYDNLTTAVRKVLQHGARELQGSFRNFKAYYTFETRFCNPGEGHEKGGVEGLVGYSRRNFLVPIPEVESFEELNQHLIEQCERHSEKRVSGRPKDKNISHYFSEVKDKLLPLPASPYDEAKRISVKVTKYQTARIDSNWYSVPTTYVGSKLTAKVGCWKVLFFEGSQKVAEHQRSFNSDQWVLDPLHYLSLLQRKPGAFEEAKPIRLWRKSWPQAYETMLLKLLETKEKQGGIQEFLRILQLHQEYPADQVEQAVQKAVELKAWHVDAVLQLIYGQREERFDAVPLEVSRIPGITDQVVEESNLECFNELLMEVS